MTMPNYSILPNQAVHMALATTKIDCVVTEIKVWLKTLTALSSSTIFITSNNLKPEIFAKAGIADTDYFTGLQETDAYTEGDFYVYEVKLYHLETT